MLTEDIDVSWKLQLAHWDIRFEPRAAVLDPDARNAERPVAPAAALGDGRRAGHPHRAGLLRLAERRMWPIFAEYVAQHALGLFDDAHFGLWALGKFAGPAAGLQVPGLFRASPA